MRILLTFDVELWCTGWRHLDSQFPAAFERYVYGCSDEGCFALPKTLQILAQHELKAVFFVESLFAARFGVDALSEIVTLIADAGQEIQLHLHPEWADEARPTLLPSITEKRKHLHHYTLDDQAALIGHGLRLLEAAGVRGVTAFRAGGFSSNAETLMAAAQNGLRFDSSVNTGIPYSGLDLRDRPCVAPFEDFGICEYPMSVFRDGIGAVRHAQIGACSTWELVAAMEDAYRIGWPVFVVLSHNFELLRPHSCRPDGVVVRRFESLARFLGTHRGRFPTTGFRDAPSSELPSPGGVPRCGLLPTAKRIAEQGYRQIRDALGQMRVAR